MAKYELTDDFVILENEHYTAMFQPVFAWDVRLHITLVNYGQVTAIGSPNAWAFAELFSSGFPGEIHNYGTVHVVAGRTAYGVYSGSYAPAVFNYGTWEIESFREAYGLLTWDGEQRVVNEGLWRVQGEEAAFGIVFINGGDVVNSGSIEVTSNAGGAVAIDAQRFEGHTIINNGDITVSGVFFAHGINVWGSAFPVFEPNIINNGSITAEVAIRNSLGGITPTQHTTEWVLNNGVINGAVDLFLGDDILENTNVINGDVLMGDDNDRVDNTGGVINGSIDMGLGADSALGGAGSEHFLGGDGDDALDGAAGDDLIEGGEGADEIHGGDGDDRFIQGLGQGIDQITGEAGFDTIDYSTANAGVTVQLSGYATSGGVTLATFSGIEAAVGSAFADALIGSAANNRIAGGLGADWLVGGDGADTFVQTNDATSIDQLFGDAGIDTIDYSGAGAGVTVQLIGWSTNSAGSVTLATFTGIENAVGSAFADALIGDASGNRITGGAGADWLVGQGGDDTFLQGVDTSSIDRLFGDAGMDAIDYSGASAGVAVQLSGYATTGDGAVTLATFTGIENAVGSNFADALIGDTGDNRITGMGGADWLVGGAGADTFVYQAVEATRDSIRDFTADDLVDLSAIDANPTTGGDDPFVFATLRHAGVVGEAVVANSGEFSLVSLHLDGDTVADMTIQIVHQDGFVLNAADFVL